MSFIARYSNSAVSKEDNHIDYCFGLFYINQGNHTHLDNAAVKYDLRYPVGMQVMLLPTNSTTSLLLIIRRSIAKLHCKKLRTTPR